MSEPEATPPRTAEELRLAIAAERESLANDIDLLRQEAIALKPALIGGTIALILISRRKYLKFGYRLIRRIG